MVGVSSLLLVLAGLITVDGLTFYDELLSVKNLLCNNKKIDKWDCLLGGARESWKMKFCWYQCPDKTKYICRKDTHHGLIEFCSKDETCEAGTMNKVYYDDEHQKVVTEKVTCPEGFFQPWEGNCYLNCNNKHKNLKYVPNFIIVIFEGNASHSAVGHCDVDNGYVNPDNEMYINISLEEYAKFCYYDDKYKTRCPAGHRLLPDSTCVANCADGFVPDRDNYFKCVPRSSTITFRHIAQASKADTAAVSITTDTSSIDVISSASPAKTTVSTTVGQGPFHSSNWFSSIIIAGVLLLLGAIFFIYKGIKAKNYTYNSYYKCVINNFLPHALHGTVNIGDSVLSISGSEIKRKIFSDAGLSTSDFDEEQFEVVAEIQPNQCRDQPYLSEECSDETECKRSLLPEKAVAKFVNPVKPMRQDYNVQMELLKNDGE